jgi:hypothetical protein
LLDAWVVRAQGWVSHGEAQVMEFPTGEADKVIQRVSRRKMTEAGTGMGFDTKNN